MLLVAREDELEGSAVGLCDADLHSSWRTTAEDQRDRRTDPTGSILGGGREGEMKEERSGESGTSRQGREFNSGCARQKTGDGSPAELEREPTTTLRFVSLRFASLDRRLPTSHLQDPACASALRLLVRA